MEDFFFFLSKPCLESVDGDGDDDDDDKDEVSYI